MIPRTVEPEWLDSLPPDDPRAIHSRRDLRLINRWMGNAAHLQKAIGGLGTPPRTIVELGAGDGSLMLRLARRLRGPVDLWLLDMQPVISPETLAQFRTLGWNATVLPLTLEDWLRQPAPPRVDLILANLFLHHFQDSHLTDLFTSLSQITKAFVSCDPRRWRPALCTTQLLWLIGCNAVTRHDAWLSIRAGFQGRELSNLWPKPSSFLLSERPAGWTSHLFIAEKPPEERRPPDKP